MPTTLLPGSVWGSEGLGIIEKTRSRVVEQGQSVCPGAAAGT
jgi:hypothetical protein